MLYLFTNRTLIIYTNLIFMLYFINRTLVITIITKMGIIHVFFIIINLFFGVNNIRIYKVLRMILILDNIRM